MTGGAVLAIDYRLMPEHPRRAGIDDCRNAWRWLLANGSDGATPAQRDCSSPATRPAAT
jgi:monoterpene epsilon-lactone hydrolase